MEPEPEPGPGPEPGPERTRKRKVVIRLADGKERAIRSMVATTFWGPDGSPISAQVREDFVGFQRYLYAPLG